MAKLLRYTNAALGRSQGSEGHPGKSTSASQVRVAKEKNPDGSISFVTISPSLTGLELVVGTGATKTLVFHDAQHEYTFTAK